MLWLTGSCFGEANGDINLSEKVNMQLAVCMCFYPSSQRERYLESSHGDHHALLHILRAAQVLVLRQEVMRYSHQGVPRPALEPVHGAARYQAWELFRSKVRVRLYFLYCYLGRTVVELTFKARLRNFSPTGEKQRTTCRLLRTRDRKKS